MPNQDTVEFLLQNGLTIFELVIVGIWWLERQDRKAAWKAYNELIKENLGAIKDFNNALTILESKIK